VLPAGPPGGESGPRDVLGPGRSQGRYPPWAAAPFGYRLDPERPCQAPHQGLSTQHCRDLPPWHFVRLPGHASLPGPERADGAAGCCRAGCGRGTRRRALTPIRHVQATKDRQLLVHPQYRNAMLPGAPAPRAPQHGQDRPALKVGSSPGTARPRPAAGRPTATSARGTARVVCAVTRGGIKRDQRLCRLLQRTSTLDDGVRRRRLRLGLSGTRGTAGKLLFRPAGCPCRCRFRPAAEWTDPGTALKCATGGPADDRA
jgi:hypothetical protein